MTTCALACESLVLRRGIKQLLDSEAIQVVAETESIEGLQEIFRSYSFNLLICDLSGNLQVIKQKLPNTLIISFKDNPGADLYLSEKDPDNLLVYLKQINSRQHNPEITSNCAQITGLKKFMAFSLNNPLEEKEQEILELLSRAYDDLEIAKILNVKPKTIRNNISKILAKLKARDRTQAIVIGLRGGLVS